MNSELQTLAQTLLASKLAASQSEAMRMAQDMLGVAEKVNNDNKKEHIYAVSGYKAQQSAATPNSQPTPSPDVAAFSSQQDPFLTAQPHPNKPQQSAVQQATTSPSPDSASVDQGEVGFSTPAREPSTPSPLAEAPSQQATMLAQDALNFSGARPEDRFADQFAGKTLAELSAESTPEQDRSTTQSSDFLNLRSQPEQQMSNNAASAPSSSSGWPSEAQQAATVQPEPAPVEQPAAEEQQESQPQKKSGFSEAEKKLAEEVDLAKVFNFGSR